MRIKAIMLGLAVSGLLGFAKADSVSDTERQIDSLNINPSNPGIIKEMAKAMVRIDNSVKQVNLTAIDNYNNLHTAGVAILQLQEDIKQLKKEVATLKAKHLKQK